MADNIDEALHLANSILGNVELRDITLEAVMLKCARLARLLGDAEKMAMFSHEAGGYPSTPDGVPQNVFELGRMAGRVYQQKSEDGAVVERMSTKSVAVAEAEIEAAKLGLANSQDPDIAISSANPNQMVWSPSGNQGARNRYNSTIPELSKILATSRSTAYEYAASVYYELKFSMVAASIFDRTRETIDAHLVGVSSTALAKTEAISENLRSENPEDWANAVHGCRRLLQDVADSLFPARNPEERNGRMVKLGPDNYVNRLVCFIEDNSKSKTSQKVIGSTLAYVGERLDAVFSAAQKGSHSEIEQRSEAERYVVYTYLLLGDIFAVKQEG